MVISKDVGSTWMNRQTGIFPLLIIVAAMALLGQHLPAGVEAFVPSSNYLSASRNQCGRSISQVSTSSSKHHSTSFLSLPLHMYLGEEGASMRNDNGTQDLGSQTTTTNTDKSTSSAYNNSSADSVGGNFGDIMSPKSSDADILFRDGLITSESNSLAKVYGIHHPMDRIAVTANGNLQRIVSSYYDAPVTVTLKHCHPVEDGIWDRCVHLSVFDQVFCKADSKVQVHNDEWKSLVESGTIGLGQLFRYQNVLPEFILHAAGPLPDGGFWRKYTLECSSMTCLIHEEFCPHIWDLSPLPENEESKWRDWNP